MTLFLAAVGATVAALFELTTTAYLRVGDAQPHLVLVLAVVVTIAFGLDAGLTWAFVGGMTLDVLAQRPLGTTSFTLLLCVGGAAIIAHGLARLRPFAPIAATFLLSLVYTVVMYVLISALSGPLPATDPVGVAWPGAIYDAIVAGIVGPLTIAVRDRRLQAERVDW